MDFSKIKGFAFDVDGVFTDGGILCDLEGELYRTFDAKDGFAIRMAVMNGYPVGVITGGRSVSNKMRFLTSGVPEDDVYLKSRDKTEDFKAFCDKHGLDPEEVLFMGDDIPDIPAMRLSGCPACPADAVEEVLKVASFISTRPGGRGAVREIVQTIMQASGRWDFDVAEYKRRF